MPVFISYQRVDETKARQIAERLKEMGIRSYIDVMDPALGTATSVTATILRALEQCTHLLAVVSASTVLSWWVPFEIGAATKGDRRIASFRRDSTDLPEFLKIWPVLDYDRQLADFAIRYYQDSAVGQKGYQRGTEIYKSVRSADQFHARLKEDLGQA